MVETIPSETSLGWRDRKVSLRALLAFTAGSAFVTFLAKWMAVSLGHSPLQVAAVLTPWALGSLCGFVLGESSGQFVSRA